MFFLACWPLYAIISDGRQPLVQQWDVCDVSSKSIHDDDDCDNNNDDFQIHQQYGHSVHQSCQSTMLNILKPK